MLLVTWHLLSRDITETPLNKPTELKRQATKPYKPIIPKEGEARNLKSTQQTVTADFKQCHSKSIYAGVYVRAYWISIQITLRVLHAAEAAGSQPWTDSNEEGKRNVTRCTRYCTAPCRMIASSDTPPVDALSQSGGRVHPSWPIRTQHGSSRGPMGRLVQELLVHGIFFLDILYCNSSVPPDKVI